MMFILILFNKSLHLFSSTTFFLKEVNELALSTQKKEKRLFCLTFIQQLYLNGATTFRFYDRTHRFPALFQRNGVRIY